MRKLLLASFAANVIHKIIPNLPAHPEDLNVAFIPNARDVYKFELNMPDLEKERLFSLNFNISIVDLKTNSRRLLMTQLNKADVIFVAGGNTFYLLELMNNSGFTDNIGALLDHGKIYIGSSAGAVVAGPNIEFIKKLDDPTQSSLKVFKGLSIVDFLLIPHYGEGKYMKSTHELYNNLKKQQAKVIPLTDCQAVWIEGNKISIIDSN